MERGERVTQKDGLFGEVFADCTREELIARLFEYEETGFSPKEIKDLEEHYDLAMEALGV